jgi:hypothetical protein
MTKVQRHGRLTIFQAAAVDDERLGNAAFRVLAALGTYSDENGWCFPTQNTLASRLRITRQAVSKSLHQLEELGYITIHFQYGEDRAQRGSKYRLCLDFLPESPPQPDVTPPQRHVAPPATSEVAPPATSEVAHNVPSKRPKLTRGVDADSFAPTSLDLAWATKEYPEVDLRLQTEMFLDHARATARIIVDWSAAWKNWIRKAPQFSPRSTAHRTQADHNSARSGRLVH